MPKSVTHWPCCREFSGPTMHPLALPALALSTSRAQQPLGVTGVWLNWVATKGICLNICFILNCGNNKVTGDMVNKILSTHSSLGENSAWTCLITYNNLKLCPGNRGILVSNSLFFSKTYTCQKEKTLQHSYIVISRMLWQRELWFLTMYLWTQNLLHLITNIWCRKKFLYSNFWLSFKPHFPL